MDLMFIDVDCAEDLGRYSNAALRIAKKIVLSKSYQTTPTITIGKNVTLIFDGGFIYDNHYCVNGYKWQDKPAALDTDPHPTTAVEFKDRNVVCAKDSLPSSNEGWVKGDIIINNGETSTAAMWYFNGTKWIAR